MMMMALVMKTRQQNLGPGPVYAGRGCHSVQTEAVVEMSMVDAALRAHGPAENLSDRM